MAEMKRNRQEWSEVPGEFGEILCAIFFSLIRHYKRRLSAVMLKKNSTSTNAGVPIIVT